MTELDDALVPAALEMVTEFGKTVTVTTETITYDPDTGRGTAATVTHASQKMAGPFDIEETYIADGTSKDATAEGIFAASGLVFTVAQGMRVAWGGVTYTVVAFAELHSGEQIAAYVVFFKRA